MMRPACPGCSIAYTAGTGSAELPSIATPSEDEIVAEYEDRLRSMALSDEGFIESELSMAMGNIETSRLDPKTHALVTLAALLAADAAPASYHCSVERALAAGASVDEIVGTLVAVAPRVGLARVVSAAPELALALGYDVDAALEALNGTEAH
jgi:alkylhydroperoxidase/carboxymuconolactone decarboxylase family protein YurZ